MAASDPMPRGEAQEYMRTLFSEANKEFEKQRENITKLKSDTEKMYTDITGVLEADRSERAANSEEMCVLKNQLNEEFTKVKGEVSDNDLARSNSDDSLSLQIKRTEQLELDLRSWTAGQQKDFRELCAKSEVAMKAMQDNLQAILSNAKSTGFAGSGDGGGPRPDRERQIFDPRDYKIAEIGDKVSLAGFKKWRHEVEMYIDTIGPSWAGVSKVLKQTKHSEGELRTLAALDATIDKASKLNGDVDPIDRVHFDFNVKTDLLYKMLSPKLNLDLSSEFSKFDRRARI